MVGGVNSGNVFHVSINLWKYFKSGVGGSVGKCTVDDSRSVHADKGDATLLVCLVCAICCVVSGEKGFFPYHLSALCLLDIVTSLVFVWEGKGGA